MPVERIVKKIFDQADIEEFEMRNHGGFGDSRDTNLINEISSRDDLSGLADLLPTSDEIKVYNKAKTKKSQRISIQAAIRTFVEDLRAVLRGDDEHY